MKTSVLWEELSKEGNDSDLGGGMGWCVSIRGGHIIVRHHSNISNPICSFSECNKQYRLVAVSGNVECDMPNSPQTPALWFRTLPVSFLPAGVEMVE